MTDPAFTNPAHQTIRQILADVLACDPFELPRDRPLEELGAESLDIVEISIAIEAAFQLTISDADLVKFSTVGDLLDFVDIAQAKAVAVKAIAGK